MARTDPTPTPSSYGDVQVMVSQELIREFVNHQDAEVTIAVGTMVIDVASVSYDAEMDVFVLYMPAEDLADAVQEFVSKG